MTDSINKIGADVAKMLRELEKGAEAMDIRRSSAQTRLRQVWDALERGEIVNGCTTKKAWAAFAKVDIRTCQYTLKGKRNRSAEVKKRSANHVVRVPVLKPGSMFKVDGITYQIPENVGDHSNYVAKIEVPRGEKEFRRLHFWVKEIEGTFTPLHEDEDEPDTVTTTLPIAKPRKTHVKTEKLPGRLPANSQLGKSPSRDRKTHVINGAFTLCGKDVRDANGEVCVTAAVEGAKPTCKACQGQIDAQASKETLIDEGVRILIKTTGQLNRPIWKEHSKYPERAIAHHWTWFRDFYVETTKKWMKHLAVETENLTEPATPEQKILMEKAPGRTTKSGSKTHGGTHLWNPRPKDDGKINDTITLCGIYTGGSFVGGTTVVDRDPSCRKCRARLRKIQAVEGAEDDMMSEEYRKMPPCSGELHNSPGGCPRCNYNIEKHRKKHPELYPAEMAPVAQELEKTMAAVAPEGEPKPWDNEEEWKKKSWSERVCTPGSPEREEHSRNLVHRREFPYVDPNEGDDDESDEEVL